MTVKWFFHSFPYAADNGWPVASIFFFQINWLYLFLSISYLTTANHLSGNYVKTDFQLQMFVEEQKYHVFLWPLLNCSWGTSPRSGETYYCIIMFSGAIINGSGFPNESSASITSLTRALVKPHCIWKLYRAW